MKSIISLAVKVIPYSSRNSIKSLPIIGPIQRFITNRLFNGSRFIHYVDAGPAKGIRFEVLLPEDKGIWTGSYENDFADCVSREIKPGMVAFDIGGWHGYFAGIMAAQGAGEIHVFEPLPENQQRIQKLIELNPDKEIILHKCAAGDADDKTSLVVMPDSSMAKLATSKFQSDVASGNKVEVDLFRLDTLERQGLVPAPDIIKMDVEGAELAVLQGAKNILSKHRPIIFAEIHSSGLLESCGEILKRHGYAIESLDEDEDAATSRDVYQVVAKPS
ncbi:FkbM family methyltransferase [Pseudomonadota bacterium]